MSNRFHNKFHRQNHHSDPTVGYPDSAFDPIASFEQPFKGEFYSQGDIITTQNLSAGVNLNVTNNANIFGTSVRTPNIGTDEDNSVVVLNASGYLKTDEINPGVWDTTMKFVSASDGALTVNRLTKATDAAGINESIVFDNGTNVGISEASPKGKFHVKAGSSGTTAVEPNSIGIFENSGNSYISILSPTAQYAGVVMGGPTNPYGSYVSWNHDNLALKVATNHAGGSIQLLAGTEQEAARITAAGNVGIGTTSPSEKLTVKGNLSASGTATIGTIATNDINTSFVVESNGLLQKRTLNIAAGNTVARFVSASDGALSINHLTKATDSNGINESIISDDGASAYVGGNLTISGNLTALGNSYFLNTLFTTTSAISVVNTGPGPALYVYQGPGTSDVASFYDGDGIEVLHIGNCDPGDQFGKIGINTGDPNKELTVKGSISASGTINLGTVDTNASSTSFVVLGTDNILQKRSINSAATDTTSKFVSASDGDLSVNYLTKATNSNGINESIVYDDGTNVGIGTASPLRKLHVAGQGYIQDATLPALYLGNSLNDYNAVYYDPINKIGYLTTDGAGTQMSIRTTGTDRLRIDANGNVGIGTTSPGVKLDVAGTAAVDYLRVDAQDGINEGGEISLVGAGSNGNLQLDNFQGNLRVHTLGTDNHFQILGGGSTTALRVENGGAFIGKLDAGTTNSVVIESSGTLQKRSIDSRAWGSSLVDGSGTANYVTKWSDSNTVTDSIVFDNGTNVGIGTNSPSTKLEISNSSTGANSTWQGGTDFIKLFANNGSFSEQSIAFQETGTNVGAKIGVKNTGNGAYDIIFANRITTSTTSSITEKMRITNTGDVGVGTASPGVKLDVNGVIRSNSNTVTPAATTALPSSNDVILNNQTGPVTITAFSNGVAGVTYTITNKSTHAVTLDTSASLFARGGNSWASHKCTTNSEGYIVLPQNFSCSLRMDSATIGSAW